MGLLCALLAAGADHASELARAAKKAERRGDTLQAFLLYSQAAALDPSNTQYQLHRHNLESSPTFSETHLSSDELAEAQALAAEDPDLVAESRVPQPPIRLEPKDGKKSFNLTGDARSIFEKAGAEYGITVLFDADYQPLPNLRFRMDAGNFAEAFRALELVSNSLVVPLDPHTALVARDTQQKRAEFAPAMTIAIPIPERLTPQDAQEIVTAVQQTMEIRRVAVDARRRTVLLRDNVSKVLAAQKLFGELSRLRAQVEVEVEVLAVTRNSSLDYGLILANNSLLANFGHFLQNTPSVGTFTHFLSFGAGQTLFGFGVMDALTFAMVSKGSSSSMLRSTVVALDGQAVTMHIGDRYPIVTSQYVGNTSGGGTVFAPPPTVNFEDLGLVLKITPAVHGDNEVSLDVEAEYKLLGTQSNDGIPVVSSRKFQGKVRVGEGEWALLAGLDHETVSDTRTGIPGLSDLRWVGRFLRGNAVDKSAAKLVLVLKPHLLALPPWEEPTPAFWVGTESRPLSMY